MLINGGSWKSFPMWDPRMQHADDYHQDEVKSMKVALARKTTSIFCLEPPGANPLRKSMIDSILSGCVPVFFMEKEEFARVLPMHFGWRDRAAVRFDPLEVIEGRVDILNVLDELNRTGAAAAMRATIAANAHNLVYGRNGHYLDDDASGLFIKGLARLLSTTAPALALVRSG